MNAQASTLMEVHIAPDHALLDYGGYVALDVNAKRARGTRNFGGDGGLTSFGFAAEQSAGVRVRWRASGAARMHVHLSHRRACDERCAIDLDHQTCYQHGACQAQCEATVRADGKPVDGACRVSGSKYSGQQTCTVAAPSGAEHEYEVIFPWAAAIDFLGLTLDASAASAGAPLAALAPLSVAPRARLRYSMASEPSFSSVILSSELYPVVLIAAR